MQTTPEGAGGALKQRQEDSVIRMSMLEKLCDAKNTFEGKALAVFMSLVMVFSFINFSAFADAAESGAPSDAPEAQADNPSNEADVPVPESAIEPELEAAPSETPDVSEAPAQNEAPSAGPSAPATDLPTAEPGVAVVGLDFAHAYITYAGQDIALPAKSFNFPLNKELAFTASADTGYEVSTVKAVANGRETELVANEQSGEYKVPADQVTSNLVLRVEGKAVETELSTPENPSADPITNDTKINAGDADEANDTTEAPAPEDEAPEVEADVSNPAFEGYAQAGNVLVKVTAAEGVLPENTTVKATLVERQDVVDAVAETVEAEGKTLEDAIAIDVTLLDKDGNEIQPNGAVNVCFFDTNVQGEEVDVFRVSDDASQVEAIGTRQADPEVQSFDVNHFSIYVVATSGSTWGEDVTSTWTDMTVGETKYLYGTVNSSDADRSKKDYQWVSGDSNVVKVEKTGNTSATITAEGEGWTSVAFSYKYKYRGGWDTRMQWFYVSVSAPAVDLTGVAISGADEVVQFGSTQLTATLSPAGAKADLTWASSDPGILKVDSNGKVTGVTQGTATVTVYAESSAGGTVSASKDITVTAPSYTDRAQFFYLKTPTSDPASNNSTEWGNSPGNGTVNVNGATWSANGKNTFDSVANRVITWPLGFENGVVPKGDHWNTIFNAFKSTVGEDVSASDVESITLKPYKISRNNASSPDKHVDCTVEIKVKDIYTATYYLWDATDTGFVWKSAETVRAGGTTKLTSELANLLLTKTVEGRSYQLVGWFDNETMSGSTVEFPYSVTNNVNFYAKYIAGYYVNYDLAGGAWTNTSTRFEYNEGDTVHVSQTVPTKPGYTFTGWKYSVNDQIYPGNGTFSMPSMDVTLTAQWTPDDGQTYDVAYVAEGSGKVDTTSNSGIQVLGTNGVTGSTATADPGYYFEGWYVDGNKISSEATLTAAQAAANVKAEGGIHVATTFTAKFVAKKVINATPNSGSFVYDGTERVVEGVNFDALVFDGQTYTVEGLSSRAAATDATGDAPVTVGVQGTATVRDASGQDVTSQFTVNTAATGTLAITPRPVTVIANTPAEKQYDGTPLTDAGWTVAEPGEDTGLVGPDAITSVTVTGSQTYPGTSANVPSNAAFGPGKASNYNVIYQNGALKVTDREARYVINATPNSGSFVYDGTERVVEGVNFDALVFDGQTYTVEGLSSRAAATDATGDAPVTVGVQGTATVRDASGQDVTSQFTVNTAATGTLAITPRPVTVIANTPAEKQYDGTPLTDAGWTVAEPGEDTGLVGPDAITSVTVTGSQTYPGTSANVPSNAAFGPGKASNYNVIYQNGALKVEPVAEAVTVTITGNSDTQIYDGNAKTVGGYTVTGISNPLYTAADFTFAGTAEAQRTDVGITDMGLTAASFANANTNFTNVVFNVTDGKIEVTPAELTIRADDNGKAYGESDPALTVSVTGLKASDRFTGSYDVSRETGEAPGNYVISIENVVFDNQNYTVKTEPGTFAITPAGEAAIIVNDTSKTYDGTALTPTGFTPVGLTTGDYFDEVAFTGSQTGAGTSEGTVVGYVIRNAAGEDVTANYANVTVVPGNLIVTPASVIIVVADAAKVAGAADPAFAGTVSGLVAESDLGDVTYSRANVDEAVGVYADVLTATYTANPNYTVTVVPGTFTITAAPVVPPTPLTPPTPTPPTPGVTPGVTPEGAPPAVAAVIEALEDAVTPLAGPQEETIGDNENPLAGYDRVNCWVHYYLILGIIVTVLYGAGVLVRRINFTRKLKDFEDDVLGIEDESTAVPAPAPLATEGKEA